MRVAISTLPLDDLLRTADVISIHCPLNDRTRNLLTESRLRLMKPTAYLMNMGRGGMWMKRHLPGPLMKTGSPERHSTS